MRIVICSATDFRLIESEDFERFDVVVESRLSDEDLRRALIRLGGPTEDLAHVHVESTWIREQVGEAWASTEWQEKWRAMQSFAESRGWADRFGRIRAHVERTDKPTPVTPVTSRRDLGP